MLRLSVKEIVIPKNEMNNPINNDKKKYFGIILSIKNNIVNILNIYIYFKIL